MKISLIQVSSDEDKEANFQKAVRCIDEAISEKADVICLPECFLYHGEDKERKIEQLPSSYLAAFQGIARNASVNIVLGSMIVVDEFSTKPKNASFVINRDGDIVHRYDKQYLYDVERSDFSYYESDTVEPGSEVGIFELDGVTMGVGICVDVRYPEYFRELTRRGAEVVFLPSSFRMATGERAWDILTKARAIENQLFFCACGQTGGVGTKSRVGNSRLISFDGGILSEIAHEEGVISAELDLESLRAFRREFPVLKQGRKY